MNTIFITNSVQTSLYVTNSGVSSVMVDLERIGKFARQGHLDTLISSHTIESISLISDCFKSQNSCAQLIVRTNPMHESIYAEIDECIDRGAMKLMLPMFKSSSEVEDYLSFVRGRVPVTLLLETPAAFARMDEIFSLPYEFDVHVGLNDLSLGMGLSFMFELLSTGIVEHISFKCRQYSREFGFGGVARLSSQSLLSPSDILSSHIAFGSNSVILSRDWRNALDDSSFAAEMSSFRDFLASPPFFDKESFFCKIRDIAGCYV